MRTDRRQYFVGLAGTEYFIGSLVYDSRGHPAKFNLLVEDEENGDLLESEEQIGDYIGEIEGIKIYDWHPGGQEKGSFENAEEIAEIGPENLDEAFKSYRELKEQTEQGFRKF